MTDIADKTTRSDGRHVASRPLARRVCLSVYQRVWSRSVEATAAQVVRYDDVSDSVKDKLNVGGVGGACLMTVDLFRRALVLRLELCLDVRRSLFVRLGACQTPTHASVL